MRYIEKLNDKRWIKKRNRIFKRDNFTCTVCGSTKDLNVHHTFYYSDFPNPWSYPDESLLTVCHKCHYDYHCHFEVEIRDKPSKKKSKAQKPKKKKWRRNKISLAEQQRRRGIRIKPRDIKVLNSN